MVFRSPFDDLGEPRVDTKGDPVEGAFACQEFGCYETVRDARFVADIGLLTWKCSDGHYSKIENFRIDW